MASTNRCSGLSRIGVTQTVLGEKAFNATSRRSSVIPALTRPKGAAHSQPPGFYLTCRAFGTNERVRSEGSAGVGPGDRPCLPAGRTRTAKNASPCQRSTGRRRTPGWMPMILQSSWRHLHLLSQASPIVHEVHVSHAIIFDGESLHARGGYCRDFLLRVACRGLSGIRRLSKSSESSMTSRASSGVVVPTVTRS